MREQFLPVLREDLARDLGGVSCDIDVMDGQTVNISYRPNFDDAAILPVIRLEIGALAAWTPVQERVITPYAAEWYPKVFKQPTTHVLTVLPTRTFWEKATILHREANRSADKLFPSRYSRHYYDLYCMAQSPVKEAAFDDLALLQKVVAFKEKFYRCSWALYEQAHPKTLKLMPQSCHLKVLREDYDHMQNMIFCEKIEFEQILEGIQQLENDIHQLG